MLMRKSPILLKKLRKKSKNNSINYNAPEYSILNIGGVVFMKKISTNSSNNILLKYILKVVITSVITILLFTYIFSKITYKFDLDLKINTYFAIVICIICAAVTAFVSVIGIKNNGFILGAVAQIPLVFYSILNVIFNDSSFLFFIIKAVIIISVGMLFGQIASKKTVRLRLKK